MESSHWEESPKELQEKLECFKDIYPSIVQNDRKLAYSGKTGKSSYVLQATPTIIDTWHEIPMTSSESGISETNEVSNWIKYKDYFPTLSAKGPVNIVPGDLSEGSNRNRMPNDVKVFQ